MTRLSRWRWALLITALLTALAAMLPEPTDATGDVAIATARARPVATRTATLRADSAPGSEPASSWPAPIRRAASAAETLASSTDAAWSPPPPPPAPPAPPPQRAVAAPPPAAPPLPFTWIGRLEEDGRHKAVLQGERKTIAAQAGDTLEGQWRIEALDESQMTVVWLPGQQKQQLSLRAP